MCKVIEKLRGAKSWKGTTERRVSFIYWYWKSVTKESDIRATEWFVSVTRNNRKKPSLLRLTEFFMLFFFGWEFCSRSWSKLLQSFQMEMDWSGKMKYFIGYNLNDCKKLLKVWICLKFSISFNSSFHTSKKFLPSTAYSFITKGQIFSEAIVLGFKFPQMQTKFLKDFCPTPPKWIKPPK